MKTNAIHSPNRYQIQEELSWKYGENLQILIELMDVSKILDFLQNYRLEHFLANITLNKGCVFASSETSVSVLFPSPDFL